MSPIRSPNAAGTIRHTLRMQAALLFSLRPVRALTGSRPLAWQFRRRQSIRDSTDPPEWPALLPTGPRLANNLLRQLISLPRSIGHIFRGQDSVRRQLTHQRRYLALLHCDRDPFGSSLGHSSAACPTLYRPGLVVADGPGSREPHVTDFARHIRRTVIQAPSDDDARTQTGPHGEENHILHAPSCSESVLGYRSGIGIIFQTAFDFEFVF